VNEGGPSILESIVPRLAKNKPAGVDEAWLSILSINSDDVPIFGSNRVLSLLVFLFR